MSAVDIEWFTEDEARARRAEILREVGDEDEFRARARRYLLDDREQALADELDDLDFLLTA